MFKKYNFKHNLITQSYNAIQNCTAVSYFKASLRDHCRDTEKYLDQLGFSNTQRQLVNSVRKILLSQNFPPLKLGKNV